MRVAADEALSEVDIGLLLKERLEVGRYVFLVGLSLRVGSHELQGGDKEHVHSLLLEVNLHHMGGKEFSLGQDKLLLLGSEELPRGAGDALESLADEGLGRGPALLRGIQFPDGLEVLGLQAADDVAGAVGIPVIQIAGNLYQRVSGAGHGRQNDQRAPLLLYQACDFLNPGGRPYGGTAEFHDFHNCLLFCGLQT